MKYVIILALLLCACRGPRGDEGQVGTTGTPGMVGPNGIPGGLGPQGVQGPTGPTGEDGTVITPVQFCNGVTPSYPSTFPESGLCINGQVYGVYSANDGFLALLPPGTYNSNAVGSACTFTILANCVIQ